MTPLPFNPAPAWVSLDILAAYLPEAAIRENPTRAIKVNAQGTNHVFEAARSTGVQRVVYASTDAVNPEGPKGGGLSIQAQYAVWAPAAPA